MLPNRVYIVVRFVFQERWRTTSWFIWNAKAEYTDAGRELNTLVPVEVGWVPTLLLFKVDKV